MKNFQILILSALTVLSPLVVLNASDQNIAVRGAGGGMGRAGSGVGVGQRGVGVGGRGDVYGTTPSLSRAGTAAAVGYRTGYGAGSSSSSSYYYPETPYGTQPY